LHLNQERLETLIPVNTLQLRVALEVGDQFFVDGHQLCSVELMGTIQARTEQAPHIHFSLCDGSGVIDCKQWIDTTDGKAQLLRTAK
jgi:hypothetical protein